LREAGETRLPPNSAAGPRLWLRLDGGVVIALLLAAAAAVWGLVQAGSLTSTSVSRAGGAQVTSAPVGAAGPMGDLGRVPRIGGIPDTNDDDSVSPPVGRFPAWLESVASLAPPRHCGGGDADRPVPIGRHGSGAVCARAPPLAVLLPAVAPSSTPLAA